MGNHLSHDTWSKLRERANTLTMLDMLKAAKSEAAIEKLPTISDDSTVHALVEALASTTSGAMLVTDSSGAVIASIDLFRVVRYVLGLYAGATVTRERDIVHERYDFWLGFDTWIERRAVEVPSKNAQQVISRAAESFFSVSIKEVLADRTLERYTRTMHPTNAIPEKTRVADALHLWVEGFSNILLKADDGRLRFVTQTDLLSALLTGLVNTNLQGAGSLKCRKLGIMRKVLYSVQYGHRALQAFRLMSDRGIQAVPITGEHGWIKGEISLTGLRALRPDNFFALMGTVGDYVEALGQLDAPLVLTKDATIADVIQAMTRDPQRRTHVWIVSKHTRVTGVVSLVDIVSAVSEKLNSE